LPVPVKGTASGSGRTAAAETLTTLPGPLPCLAPPDRHQPGETGRREYQLRTDPTTALLGQWNFAVYLATADMRPPTWAMPITLGIRSHHLSIPMRHNWTVLSELPATTIFPSGDTATENINPA
jgi:hypothetical protein